MKWVALFRSFRSSRSYQACSGDAEGGHHGACQQHRPSDGDRYLKMDAICRHSRWCRHTCGLWSVYVPLFYDFCVTCDAGVTLTPGVDPHQPASEGERYSNDVPYTNA